MPPNILFAFADDWGRYASAERTRYESAGRLYNRFSHVVTERASELGIDGAKEMLLKETRQNFDAFLEARPAEKPFCYWWGPTNTHRTWERGSGKALWGLEPDDLKGRLPAFLPDVHDIREDVNDYLGECLAVDAGLGVLIERLEAIGELDNTFIVVSGDHGIPGFPRAKCNLYNIGCEVALAARWPERIPSARADEDVQPLFEIGFGKRPREELYDLRVDPHYMNNVATNPDYEQIRKDLANELMGLLRENDDPRLVESPCRFEQAPYSGPLEGDELQEEIERLTNLGLSALIPNVKRKIP